MGSIEHIANLRSVASILQAIGANPKFPESRSAATQMAERIVAAADYFVGATQTTCIPMAIDVGRGDNLSDFLIARVARSPKSQISAVHLFTTYTRWCAARGITPMTFEDLHLELPARGFKRGITRGSRVWLDTDFIHGGEEDDIAAWRDRAAQRYVARSGLPLNTALAFATPTWEDALKAEDGIVAKALQTDPVAAVDDDIACWEA